MNTLGIIGGMSWQSTQSYYQLINQGVAQRLGGLHSAQLILNSVDFATIAQLQHDNQWSQLADRLGYAATQLQRAGADCVLIATNTMHKVADEVNAHIDIPLLHIVDAVGEALQQQGITTVGLLGTAFTMEQPFYRQRLYEQFDISVLVPNAQQRQRVHEVIYQQLCKGHICQQAKSDYLNIVTELGHQGAHGVILGCTEIGLLLKQQDTAMALFDTTALHAQAAVNFALR
ncbi:aspartate/glutamate racemase family protein [Pseudoalteromonas ruthenica]|uniref:aspartate/glutamate racemase family protein n=1 Tax=Pseudoalteromonas ruthenica TaxID=151081 RepID=UPI00110BE1FE|nr:aspartate/glutamate racemase family protein [Pseudoalteromonas ruthenica]TMO43508.1 aspartate racemase [Pseudoalteromonas ruthenica]TMO52313.1 aspartate racemase [Pseudoalteromonas ruthenica]